MRVLAAALALTLALSAQARPDLSGTWTLDTDKSDAVAVAAGRGATPPQLIISFSGTNDLTITQNGQPVPYKFDGTEMPGPPGGETKSTAAWEGDKLVITWRREYFAGKDGYLTRRGRDVYSVAGTVLTIEKTTTTPQGVSTTRKVVYSKG